MTDRKKHGSRVRFLADKWGARVDARSSADHSLAEGEEAFALLVDTDPTPRKEYLDWICRIYASGGILAEDRERVKNTLVLFDRWKRRLPLAERDIGRHATEQSAWAAVERFDPSRDEGESGEPEGREFKRRERAKALAESEVCEDEGLDGWIVASPGTLFASRWWARGTRWCTGMKNVDHFTTYHRRGALRVFVTPDGRKFQAHVATGSCANSEDRMIDFASFIEGLPRPAVELLKSDMRAMLDRLAPAEDGPVRLSSDDMARAIMSVPQSLVDEETAAALRQKGRSRVHVHAEEDGWRLLSINDPLAKWAFGLSSGARHSWMNPNFLLLELPDGGHHATEMEASSSGSFRVLAQAMRAAPPDFRQNAVDAIARLWEAKSGYRTPAFLTVLSEAFGADSLPWTALAKKIAKKPRDWYDFTVPPEFIDDEVADILATGWNMGAIPAEMMTKERLMSFLSRRPDLIAREVELHGYAAMVDRDVAMAIASFQSGEGLPLVPAPFSTREFHMEALTRYPRAIKHVPEEWLTYEACCQVVERSPMLISEVPDRFRKRDLYLRAVRQNGGLLSQVPSEFRDEEVCLAAVERNPDCFPHASCPLTYGHYLKGVTVSGSALARVPLAFRDAQMCLAAIKMHADAYRHVPPKVRQSLAEDPLTAQFMSGLQGKLSSRYDANDPIHTFEPADERPEKLLPISVARGTGITTGPAVSETPAGPGMGM